MVAVKAFRLDVVPEVTAALAQGLERLAARPVEHFGVVPVVGGGLEGMTAFLAFEYVVAETLDVGLRRMAPARLEAVLPLLRQVGEAIEAAWAVGLGHGALHPRDIFVVSDTGEVTPGGRQIRVTGFGVVSALEVSRIPVPARRPYSAPERVDGSTWDIRADVYSLGVIAHELLTGRCPAGPVEEDIELAPGTSGEQRTAIGRVLSRALVTDPAQRFATPTAFVEALATGDVLDVPVATDMAIDEGPDVGMVAEPQLEAPEIAESEFDLGIEPEFASEPEQRPPHVIVGGRVPASDMRMREPFSGAVPLPAPPPGHAGRAGNGGNALNGGLALMLVLAFIAGIGIGYWWRGPTAVAAVEILPVTEVIDDGPIGTEVSVPPPASPAQAETVAKVPSVVSEPVALSGRLLVRSVPAGATVSVNDRVHGTTPAVIEDLVFGTHAIAVSRPGYQPVAQQVTVSQAVPAREITIELTRTAAPVTVASTGSVSVVTRPAGATVSIDGRAVGTTPSRVAEVTPGPHAIRVELAGYKSVTTTVDVRAGQESRVQVSLQVSLEVR